MMYSWRGVEGDVYSWRGVEGDVLMEGCGG